MRRRTRASLALLGLGLALAVIVQPQALLALQHTLGAAGRVLAIGHAQVAVPSDWLLLSHREERDAGVRLLGFIPFPHADKRAPPERYYAFEALDVPGSSITLIEAEPARQAMENRLAPGSGSADGPCTWLSNFQGFVAVECLIAQTYTLYLPELRITLISTNGAELLQRITLRPVWQPATP